MVMSPPRKRRLENKPMTKTKSYDVEDVIGFKLVRSELRFFIKWNGFDNSHNTWEPVDNLVSCTVFRKFVEEKFISLEKEIYVNMENVKQRLKSRILKATLQPKGITMLEIQPFDPFEFKVLQVFYFLVQVDEKFQQKFEEQVFKKVFFARDLNQRIRNDALLDRILKKEDIVVTIENDADFSDPPQFEYITKNYLIDELYVYDRSKAKGCRCKNCNEDSECCVVKNRFPYKIVEKGNEKRVVLKRSNHEEKIYECGELCQCGKDCINRLTQQKKQYPLCLFKTNDRGWGIKASQTIPKGAYIIEYVGELMGQIEADARAETSYLFDCNFDNVTDKKFYTIDAFRFGNLSRFINHSCEPNTNIRFVSTCQEDPKDIKLCFFSNQRILKGHEITLDYTGGNERGRSEGGTQCSCGAAVCKKLF